jgi:hypothetical protein
MAKLAMNALALLRSDGGAVALLTSLDRAWVP